MVVGTDGEGHHGKTSVYYYTSSRSTKCPVDYCGDTRYKINSDVIFFDNTLETENSLRYWINEIFRVQDAKDHPAT